MCADACQADRRGGPGAAGGGCATKLAEFLPAAASLGNPIDMIATASAEDYRRTIRTLIDADACDAILAIFVPPLVTEAVDVAIALREVAETEPDGPDRGRVHDQRRIASGPRLGARPGAGLRVSRGRRARRRAGGRVRRWRARPRASRSPHRRASAPNEAAAIISEELAQGSDWLPPASVVAAARVLRPTADPDQGRVGRRRGAWPRLPSSAAPSRSRQSPTVSCTRPTPAGSGSAARAPRRLGMRPPRIEAAVTRGRPQARGPRSSSRWRGRGSS